MDHPKRLPCVLSAQEVVQFLMAVKVAREPVGIVQLVKLGTTTPFARSGG